MKRSEMVNLIEEVLERYLGDDFGVGLPNELLDELEKNGMLPPRRKADQKSMYGYAEIYKWNSEDES